MSQFRVGLTGGIGSGKSTIAHLFSQLGVPIIDTDELSHQLTAPAGAAIATISTIFGSAYISENGALDRGRMRELIFSDPSAKLKLEQILHPLILGMARTQAEANPAPYVMLVVPLLFESGQYLDWLQRTLLVDCPEELQLQRTMSRSKLDEATVRAIMAQQFSRQQRLQLANDVIVNDVPESALPALVERLHRHYLELATRTN